MEILDLKGSLEFSLEQHVYKFLADTPFCSISVVQSLTRMVLYRVQAGADRHAELLDAWPAP